MSLREVLAALAAVPFTMAIVVMAIGIARVPGSRRAGPAELLAALGLGLEFMLAAGLLRLASIESYAGLAAVGAIIALRRIIGVGLRASVRSLGAARFMRIRA